MMKNFYIKMGFPFICFWIFIIQWQVSFPSEGIILLKKKKKKKRKKKEKKEKSSLTPCSQKWKRRRGNAHLTLPSPKRHKINDSTLSILSTNNVVVG